MVLPPEIRDFILSFIVDDKNIHGIWTHFPGIKHHKKNLSVNWYWASRNPTLSEEFILDFHDRVDWKFWSRQVQ
jgi:hypothetical protein